MDIPSLFMIPSAVSSGKVHSVFPNSTDADFQFNRDSDATRVNSEGLIERVGYYGSESVVNGNFDTDSNWTKTQSVIENGQAIITSPDGSYAGIIQNSILTSSKTYYYSINVISISGTMVLRAGAGTDTDITTSGVHTGYIVANGTGFEIKRKTGALSVIIDSVSLKQVNGDRARLNYEIEGGLVNTKPSLLLEPQSTNVFPYSNFYGSGALEIYSSGTQTHSVTNNYSISPDGTKNAIRLQATVGSSSSDRVTLRDLVTAGASTFTFSVYAKSNTDENITLGFHSGGGTPSTFVATSDWQRFTYTATLTATSNVGVEVRGGQTSSNVDVSLFGYQLENLSYATSYIPTNGSTQTRAAETCNGAGTSSIFNDSEGILYAEIQGLINGTTGDLYISISDNSVSNSVALILHNTANRINFRVYDGGSLEVNISDLSTNQTQNLKVACKYKSGNYALWINGVESVTASSGSLPSGLSKISFNDGAGSNSFYGKVKDIRVYNTKEMTDSEVDILLTKITS